MRNLFFFLSLLFLAVTLSCSDEQVGSAQAGRIEVLPNPIGFAQVNIGESDEVAVVVANQANESLTVFEMRLEAREGGTIEGLELVNPPSTPFEVDGNGGAVNFAIKYTPTESPTPVQGRLVFVSSDDRYTREAPLEVDVNTLGNEARLQASPGIVRFTRQAPGARETQSVSLRNIGSAPLTIWSEPAYGGGQDFKLSVPERTYPLVLPIYDADAAIENPDEYELKLDVEYAPIGNGQDSGEILVVSNDDSADGGANGQFTTVIDVAANADAACILVSETTKNFGQVPIGGAGAELVVMSNCGTQNLEVSSIRLTENSADDEFELELGGLDANEDGDLDRVITLRPGEEQSFLVRYTPEQEGSDTGTIVIGSNDPLQGELEIGLIARGSDGICPTARAGAFVKGGSQVLRQSFTAAPLQYIVLDATESTDEDGRVVEYEWEFVRTPPGVNPELTPTEADINDEDQSRREFRLLTAGTYEVELRVKDNDGFLSCGDPAKVTIVAVPSEKVLVELTWTNPEDPDETDNVGSDVDIHVLKMGPGRWFEAPYDVYFRNPDGLWGQENPSLDIDDRDGLGPENVQMDDPANCEWYAIGVHYYRQFFGTAYVTVRVYINTNLVFEKINKPLTRGGQFWDVARIHWDSGQVYEVDNILEAEPNGSAPPVSAGMANSGLCTTQNLYPIQ